MIEVGLGDGRFGRRRCASMIACCRLRFRFAFGRCTTRGPTGWQRERAPNATHTEVRDTRVHHTPRIAVFWGDLEGPGLPRRLAASHHRRAPNATHADGRETCVRQTIRLLVYVAWAPCTRHVRETLEIIAREQRATSRHARK